MKRTLSLLVALALVFTMIPAVFAADNNEDIGMDELTQGMEIDNPTPAEIGKPYTTTWLTFTSKEGGEAHGVHYFEITANEDGNLELTVNANGTVALEGVTAKDDGTYTVAAGEKYIVVVTKDAEATGESTWSATYIAPHVHAAATYINNGDGTHDGICECKEVVVDNEAHTDADSNNVCDSCGAELKAACEYVDADQDGKCDNCGEAKLDESLAFYGKNMVLGADIRGIFQVRKMKNVESPYESFKVYAQMEGKEEKELELVATSDKSKHTTYGYAITVAAKEMADDLNARIVGITAEGEAFTSNIESWTIMTGAVSLLNGYIVKTDEASQNSAKMLVNMLNYGAEAQKHFEHSLDKLATKDLSDAAAALIVTDEPEMEVIPWPDETGVTATLKSISLNLDAKAEILPIFKVPKADTKEIYRAEVTQVHTAPNGTVMNKTFTINGADCLKSGTSLGVYINNLESDEMRDVLTVTLYKNDAQVSATVTFSLASAIKGDLYLKNAKLANALMVYGDCAYAVFGNNALTQ